jgi:hypothetical protein
MRKAVAACNDSSAIMRVAIWPEQITLNYTPAQTPAADRAVTTEL